MEADDTGGTASVNGGVAGFILNSDIASFSASFDECDSSKEAEHDHSKNKRSGATAPAISFAGDCAAELTGVRDVEAGSCAIASGSGRPDTGGIK